MAMTIDPVVAEIVAAAVRQGRVPFERQTPAEARASYRAGCALSGPLPAPLADVSDGQLAGVRCRVYRPTRVACAPALMYLHGGGWVVGDLESHDGVCRRLASDSGAVVVAVDYRLAPEHPAPAAFEDTRAAWLALARDAASLGLDPARMGVAGDSAGGVLAASLALACRDDGLALPRCQLLLYPITDIGAEAASYAEVAGPMFLTASTMRWFIGHYAPAVASRLDWRLSPLRAADLAALPPAFVLTVGFDPLCDEGRAYAQRLVQAGNQVTALHLANQIHGLLTQARAMPAAEIVWASAAAFMRLHLA